MRQNKKKGLQLTHWDDLGMCLTTESIHAVKVPSPQIVTISEPIELVFIIRVYLVFAGETQT